MIKGIAKMEFGTGDILMTAALSEGVGALCCVTQEPHNIHERVIHPKVWSAKNAEVILTFTKTESIDSMIAELQLVKSMMDESYKFTDNDIPIDPTNFDEFMDKQLVLKPGVNKEELKQLLNNKYGANAVGVKDDYSKYTDTFNCVDCGEEVVIKSNYVDGSVYDYRCPKCWNKDFGKSVKK